MALFKQSDPEVTLQKAIDAERAFRDQLEARLIAAKRTAEECQNIARKAHRALVSDVELDKAEAKEIASERRVTNLTLELADATSKIADLETQLAVAADQRIRRATALEIEKIGEGFTTAAANTIAALAALVQQTEKMIRFMPDAQGLHIFADKVRGELPGNVEMLTGLLRSYTDAVLAGGFAATLPQPAPPPKPLPLPAPVTQVCSLKAVTWLDSTGAVQKAARGEDISLPPATAKHAIAIGACCAMSDPRRRTVKDNPGRGKPLFRNCMQLSEGMVDNEPEPLREPTMRSAPPATIDPLFQIVPPSQLPPPRQVSVQGARNLDDVARANKDKP